MATGERLSRSLSLGGFRQQAKGGDEMIERRLVIGMLVLLVATTGCAKRPAPTVSAPAPTGETATPQPGSTAEPVRPVPPRGGTPAANAFLQAPGDFVQVADLREIRFDFDKYSLRSDDRKVLDGNAVWLKANGKRLVVIQGHCDERGTNQYNIALGERRAKAALNY